MREHAVADEVGDDVGEWESMRQREEAYEVRE